MNSIGFFILMIGILSKITQAQIKFCQPVTPNIDQNSLPQLPQQFQTRMEINVANQLKSSNAIILYDYFDRRCEMITERQNKTIRTIYYFDRDEIFTIEDNICTASKLSQSSSNIFFGLDTLNQLNYPKPPSFVLHFNNGFPTKKVEETTWRGIKVNHYQSCQDWPELKANVLVDYYFKTPDFQQAIYFDNIAFNELPVAAVINGYANIDQSSGTYVLIKHEYNYYEFRPFIERLADLYSVPPSTYCEGHTFKEPIPPIPNYFSFYEQFIIESDRFSAGFTVRFEYSYDMKATRQDIESAREIKPLNVDNPFKIVNDFYSGVGYALNRETGVCTNFPLTSSFIDRDQVDSIATNHVSLGEIKTPNEIIGIDDSFFYMGQRYERGMLCDVWVSKQNSTESFGNNQRIVELYMLNKRTTLEGFDMTEQVVPISKHITNLRDGSKQILHFFDFDSKPKRYRFDLSDCFGTKEKIQFGIRFYFEPALNQTLFDQLYGYRLEEPFYQEMMKYVKYFEASSLRIISPQLYSNKYGFIFYTGFTNNAPSINHFKRVQGSKIDLNLAKVKFETSSADKCSDLCLNRAQMQSLSKDNTFICRSFDVCKSGTGSSNVVCSFYNNSTVTDPSIIVQTAPECDHYSKVSQYFDVASADELFRAIEEAVIKNSFSIDLKDINGQNIISFSAKDVFIGTLQDQQQSINLNEYSSSYLTQFRYRNTDISYDKDQATKNNSVIIKEKTGVVIDECARLCITEPSFDCQSFTYNNFKLDCKWSTIFFSRGYIDNTTMFITSENDSSLFIRDPLFSYVEYPFQVTTVLNYQTQKVSTIYECASLCNKETKIKCRSFNFCLNQNDFRCLLSETNINNNGGDKDPNNVFAATCSHYSKKSEADYQLISQTQMGVAPQSTLKNATVERCAEICSFEDSFFCRSFDFFIDKYECNLYKENVKDKLFTDLKLTANPLVNHFSRLNYEENGVLKQIQPLGSKGSVKYSGGAIFGAVIALIIGGVLIGILGVFAYFKVVKKQNLLPVMKFSNPTFSK